MNSLPSDGRLTAESTLPPLIGVIDDDTIMGESLLQRLRLEGYRALWWQSGEQALNELREVGCHVLICDIRLPGRRAGLPPRVA
jgi:FixJ family two-component response regulator